MMSCRHSIAGTASTADDGSCDVNNNNMLTADNLLRLALKKPKSWKWELTTSSSSPNISFPKIQLFDGASGELMVEVDRPDCVIRSDGAEGASDPNSGSSSRELDSRPGRYRRSRTSLVKEKLSTSGDSLADIFNQLQNKGLGHKLSTSGSQYRLLDGDAPGSLQKSKSANAIGVVALDVPPAPPIMRRRSRRSLASRSSSILERISEFYGRSSTEEEEPRPILPQLVLEPAADEPPALEPEGVTIEELPDDQSNATTPIKPRPKIYKLVRSNIGTLMVREESFHTQRSLRRRQRELDSERVAGSPPVEMVELDEQMDGRPRPVDVGTRYEREINRIDGLLSRVMLSHDLQTEQADRYTASERISDPVHVVEPVNGFSRTLQNGGTARRRRSGRSVSVGGSDSSRRTRGRRSASSSSTSDGEQGSRHRAGSASRSGSQKRRGRTRQRESAGAPHATISNVTPPSSQTASSTQSRCCRRRRHHSTDGGRQDTLALEQFRASLHLREPAAAYDTSSTIDIISVSKAISASEPPAEAATEQLQCADYADTVPQASRSIQINNSAPAVDASTSASNQQQSGASDLTPFAIFTASDAISCKTFPEELNNDEMLQRFRRRRLSRSLSDTPACPRSAEEISLERLERSFKPITGSILRSRYLMLEPPPAPRPVVESSESDVAEPIELVVQEETPPPNDFPSIAALERKVEAFSFGPVDHQEKVSGRRILRSASVFTEEIRYTQEPLRPISEDASNPVEPQPPGRRRILRYVKRRSRKTIVYTIKKGMSEERNDDNEQGDSTS